MESVTGANKNTRSTVSRRYAYSECTPDRANNSRAQPVWANRGQECLLLVPKPQSQRAAKAETIGTSRTVRKYNRYGVTFSIFPQYGISY